MKTIGFIGVYDKTDLLLNLAKILTVMEKRVLIIDSTVNQKAKYVVPFISPTTSYVTNFEEIDVAVGFENIEQIRRYLGIAGELPYDILLVDADTIQRVETFKLVEQAERNFFVTAFDVFSMKKGLEILSNIQETVNLTKVLFAKGMFQEDDDYLNYISLQYKVIWSEYRIYFPIENGDLSVIMENQRAQKIKFKRLSVQYKDGLVLLANEILDKQSESSIRRALKIIEKGA